MANEQASTESPIKVFVVEDQELMRDGLRAILQNRAEFEVVGEAGDGEIAVSFINGAIRLEEQEEMVKLLRQKSGLVVAFGACAHIGGIPGLGNFWTKDTIFQRVYKEVPTVENPKGISPQEKTTVDAGELTLPEFYDTVKTLDQTIAVDYYLELPAELLLQELPYPEVDLSGVVEPK